MRDHDSRVRQHLRLGHEALDLHVGGLRSKSVGVAHWDDRDEHLDI